MKEKSKYFVVKQKAVPEVLLKVAEAKRLLESEQVMTIQEAADRVGISRSSFYKYKDDIFPFYDNTKGKTVTLVIQMDVVQRLSGGQPLLELTGLVLQFLVRECHHLRSQRIDLIHNGINELQFPLAVGAKDFFNNVHLISPTSI